MGRTMNIIVDIDGTIADCRHRRHFVIDGAHDWKSFNESMVMDTPIQPVIDLVNELAAHNYIILCTGRSHDYYHHTVKWLYDNNVSYNTLMMRLSGNYDPDDILKESILKQLKSDNRWPDLVIDDRQSVVDMWRRNGIICLQNSMKELP